MKLKLKRWVEWQLTLRLRGLGASEKFQGSAESACCNLLRQLEKCLQQHPSRTHSELKHMCHVCPLRFAMAAATDCRHCGCLCRQGLRLAACQHAAGLKACCSCGAKYGQLSLRQRPVACYSPGVLQLNATRALAGLLDMRVLLTHCMGGRLACTGLVYTAGPNSLWQGAQVSVLQHQCQAMQSVTHLPAGDLA